MINLARAEKPLGELLMGDNEFINKEKMIKIVIQAKISYFLCLGISFAFLFAICTSGFAQKPDPEDIFKKYKKAKQKFEGDHVHFLQTRNTKMHYLSWFRNR